MPLVAVSSVRGGERRCARQLSHDKMSKAGSPPTEWCPSDKNHAFACTGARPDRASEFGSRPFRSRPKPATVPVDRQSDHNRIVRNDDERTPWKLLLGGQQGNFGQYHPRQPSPELTFAGDRQGRHAIPAQSSLQPLRFTKNRRESTPGHIFPPAPSKPPRLECWLALGSSFGNVPAGCLFNFGKSDNSTTARRSLRVSADFARAFAQRVEAATRETHKPERKS